MNHVDKRFNSCGTCMPGNYYGRSGCPTDECQRSVREGCHCDPCEQRQARHHCCDQNGEFDTSFALAMGYVPMQEWGGITAPCNGLKNGTVFGELVKPFCGAGRRKG